MTVKEGIQYVKAQTSLLQNSFSFRISENPKSPYRVIVLNKILSSFVHDQLSDFSIK